MNILVTGGAGFIGSHTVDALIEKKYKVIVVDNLLTGSKINLNPRAKFYKLDIQSKSIHDIIARHHIEKVIHLAAQKDVKRSTKDPIYDAEINIMGSLNLFEACKKNSVKKIVFASSAAIYGNVRKIPTKETERGRPISPYAIAKFSCERYLRSYHIIYKISNTILRYSNVYGPRQHPEGEAGIIPLLCKRILIKKQPILFGNGEQTRDFIYIDDVVKANILALESQKSDTFNIATGKETSINDLYKKIQIISGTRKKPLYKISLGDDSFRSCLKIRKVKKELQWKPNISMDAGLIKTWDWYQQNIDFLIH